MVPDAIDQDVVVPDGPSTLDESRGLASCHCALREEALWGVLGRDSLQIPYIGLGIGIIGAIDPVQVLQSGILVVPPG